MYGGGKIVNFRPKSLFISERYEIGPWLPWINYRKSYVADRSLSVPVALSDLERRDAGGQTSNYSGGSDVNGSG